MAFQRFFIGLSGAAGGSRQARHLEPGMIFQQGDKTLSNHSCCSDDSDAILIHCGTLHLAKNRALPVITKHITMGTPLCQPILPFRTTEMQDFWMNSWKSSIPKKRRIQIHETLYA